MLNKIEWGNSNSYMVENEHTLNNSRKLIVTINVHNGVMIDVIFDIIYKNGKASSRKYSSFSNEYKKIISDLYTEIYLKYDYTSQVSFKDL